jgi:cytochrome b6-f complex iron-sulfur subunit
MTTRKDFIKQVGIIACAGFLPPVFSSCSSVRYVNAQEEGNTLKINKSDFAERSVLVVKSSREAAPLCVSRNGEAYLAVSMLCTHRGCELTPAGEQLVCPCHGSEFARDGRVLSPPATQNLRQYRVTFDNEFVIVYLR